MSLGLILVIILVIFLFGVYASNHYAVLLRPLAKLVFITARDFSSLMQIKQSRRASV